MNSSRFVAIVLLLIVWGAADRIAAEKVAALPEILGPSAIQIDEERIYITQHEAIYIYSLNDYRFIKKFGKKGEGPGEFKLSPDNMVFLCIEPDRLLINSVGRISYFSKTGEYLSERINNAGLWLQPLGKHFVGVQRVYDKEKQRWRKVCVFNENLEKVKDVYREVDGIQPRLRRIEAVTWPSDIFVVYDNKIFVAEKRNTILVFDQKGKKLYDIPLEYPKIKVTDQIKQRYIKYYKEDDPYWRARWDRLKNWYVYPEYLPVVQYFLVSDQKIYILTYRTRKDTFEFLILNTAGKHLQTVYLPLYNEKNSVFGITPLYIKNNTLFQLIENEDEEQWDLHATPIPQPLPGKK
jgi:hypothetical protein